MILILLQREDNGQKISGELCWSYIKWYKKYPDGQAVSVPEYNQ